MNSLGEQHSLPNHPSGHLPQTCPLLPFLLLVLQSVSQPSFLQGQWTESKCPSSGWQAREQKHIISFVPKSALASTLCLRGTETQLGECQLFSFTWLGLCHTLNHHQTGGFMDQNSGFEDFPGTELYIFHPQNPNLTGVFNNNYYLESVYYVSGTGVT